MIVEKVRPLYTIYWYTDFLFRVIKFKRNSDGIRLSRDPDEDPPLDRFEQSYCRSRSMVLQYALCNKWDHFITITVDPKRFDRWDLNSIYRYLSQWLRDYRKKYSRQVKYLLVPEHHQDGAWHFHGFISGIRFEHLSDFIPGVHPQKLIDARCKNFGRLAAAVGYVSLSELRDPVAAGFYVTKYITKEHAHDDFYQHLYYVSRGLRRARAIADCYASSLSLDKCLDHENQFCSCGWARAADPLYPFTIDGVEPRFFESLVSDRTVRPVDDSKLSFVQFKGSIKGAGNPAPFRQLFSQLCHTFCTSWGTISMSALTKA